MTTYIHYGSSEFDYNRLTQCTAPHPFIRKDKPEGLWASPTDAKWGWKEWCEAESFHVNRSKESFMFIVKDEAKVLHIRSLEDAKPYMQTTEVWKNVRYDELIVDKIYKTFDAMELHISDNYHELHNNNVFYTWDVDSICI